MKLIVDANILFSFFKKDSTPRELILDPELKYNLELFTPKFSLNVIGSHKGDVCSRFGISSEDFDVMLSSLQVFTKIIEKHLFEEFFAKAEEILGQHIKDIPYAALSLSFKAKGQEISLWSNEKRLKILEKYGIKVYSTSELLKELDLKQ